MQGPAFPFGMSQQKQESGGPMKGDLTNRADRCGDGKVMPHSRAKPDRACCQAQLTFRLCKVDKP